MAVPSNDSNETQNLLSQIRSGDSEAMDRLFSRYRTYLHEVIEMRLDAQFQQRIDASDLVQETQLEAARRLADYLEKGTVPFRLWLRQIARNRLQKARQRHLKTTRRATIREVPLPERSSMQLARQLIAGGSTPSQSVDKREQIGQVKRALARLSDADREILLMRNFEELPFDEVAYVLEIDVATARKRHGRALIRLSKLFHDNRLIE